MIANNKKIKRGEEKQSIFFSVFFGILFLGVISFLIISNLRISQKRSDLLERIGELNEEIQSLEVQKQELQENIGQTQSETYWEGKLREQGFKKPGEEAVVVLPSEEQAGENPEEEKGIWQQFLDKLGL